MSLKLESDNDALDYLTSRGIYHGRGIIKVKRSQLDDLAFIAIVYLCTEWDYDYIIIEGA